MATIKSYTDIEQSKALSEILPLEIADMRYIPIMDIDSMSNSGFLETPEYYPYSDTINWPADYLPCWSLAALLGVLPEGTRLLKSTNISSINDIKYHCDCLKGNINSWFDNPIDACVAMIEHLHKLKML